MKLFYMSASIKIYIGDDETDDEILGRICPIFEPDCVIDVTETDYETNDTKRRFAIIFITSMIPSEKLLTTLATMTTR